MLLNETLTEEVDDFLFNRQQWVEEFDVQIEVNLLAYFSSYTQYLAISSLVILMVLNFLQLCCNV